MQKGWFLSLLAFFCIFWLMGNTHLAHGQPSALVTVVDTSLSSGDTYQQVTVLLQNDVPIKGIELWFELGVPSSADFTTTNIKVDTIGTPPSEEILLVRNCKIETAGTLVENFEWLEAHGQVGDTAFLDCDWVKIAGWAKEGEPIPPGTGVLLKLYLDVLCIPDTTQDRITSIIINPFPVSKLHDPDLNKVESQFNSGTINIKHTLCGNLLECICGDVNTDGEVNIVDVVCMVNWMFDNGPGLCPESMGDVNLFRGVSVADIVYLINYLFSDGPAPVCVRKY
jgi:hypothetical protein